MNSQYYEVQVENLPKKPSVIVCNMIESHFKEIGKPVLVHTFVRETSIAAMIIETSSNNGFDEDSIASAFYDLNNGMYAEACTITESEAKNLKDQ